MKFDKNLLYIILILVLCFFIYFVIEVLPNPNKTENERYIQFSCRKDLGICEYDGKICFKEEIETLYGKILYNPIDCNTKKELNFNCQTPTSCAIYFTGIGCPHCARVDPYLFYDFVLNKPIVLVEYEVYKNRENAKTMEWYINVFRKNISYAGIPQIYFSRDLTLQGDLPILNNLESYFERSRGICEIDSIKKILGSQYADSGYDMVWFSGKPKIWYCNRVLILKTANTPSEDFLRAFLSENMDIDYIIKNFS